MIFGANLVLGGWYQAFQGNEHRFLITVRAEDIKRATLQAGTPVEHSVPVISVGPRQNVVYLRVPQDRADPGFVDLRGSHDPITLLLRPGGAVRRVDLPLVHHRRAPEIRFRRV